jgi:D-alanyl-D-alanine carboxypeptidase/D-alanyl-D-alanine-endopeptidase (penicillin-binding protein 4)
MRRTSVVLLAAALVGSAALPAHAKAGWKERIDRLVRRKAMGVAVRIDGERLYEHDARARRPPASNQKLLLAMALFEDLGPDMRLETRAAVRRVRGDTVAGNLYLLGSGDPAITGGGKYGRSLPFEPTGLRELALAVRASGIRRIKGRVVGALTYFAHDWSARGWRSYFPSRYIPLPSAVTFEGNTHKGVHISNPEWRAARAMTAKLESVGVAVKRAPRSSGVKRRTTDVASVQSRPLGTLVRFMNRRSSNFFAELLGKRLGVHRSGRPGTIAKGAAAIEAWAEGHGVRAESFDGSGLSYANRVSAKGLARLLDWADEQNWWKTLRAGLPTGNQGTLEDRLEGVRVRAKTGTLINVSALSGWIYLEREDEWASFSILSRGMPKYRAAAIEDKIVRILEKRARCDSAQCGKGAAVTADTDVATFIENGDRYLGAAFVAGLARAAFAQLLFR